MPKTTTAPYINPKIRSPLKTHGGKWYLCRDHLNLAPMNPGILIEPYAGGLNLTLNQNLGVKQSFASDTNWQVINTLIQIKRSPQQIIERLRKIAYDETTWVRARQYCEQRSGWPPNICDEPMEGHWSRDLLQEDAVQFLIANRMSRGGLGKAFAWSDRLRGGQPGDVNAWMTMIDSLPHVSERLQGVSLMHCHAEVLLVTFGSAEDVFWYVDPPYILEKRTAKKAYGPHEMTPEDHKQLADRLNRVKGKVMLCGYDSESYQKWYSGWRTWSKEVPNHSGQGDTKQRRIETVWMNY